MLGLHFTPACVLLSGCSLHFTHSLQSAVRSLRLTLTSLVLLDFSFLWEHINIKESFAFSPG